MPGYQPKPEQIRWIKAAAFALCLLPFLRLAWRAFAGTLGVNPIETITHSTGWWALAFLLITLAVTPLRRLLQWPWLLRLRRMFGLFAFFYACVHFSIWLVFDHFFDWPAILADIVKRPYITVGFTAFVLMIPLAATSTNAMVRRLGATQWQRLHRFVYPIALLGVLHFLWLVKKDIREPMVFVAILATLLGARVAHRLWQKRAAPAATARSPAA
ncbi:MAG TPA: protein-methionine-sulfoxide reductase heme-binding subunit MsrQ [Burkholderiales bacterium]|jgi:sulfoxide reductase heme-binding subunit YedZ|nr:protein-methionine-sulfoxide reductase heme-binding subunit MsrQ [Burkholderiales bacterium]